MPFGALGENLDVAQIVLYLFWIFFAGLIFWIRREDRREGYPLEKENTGKVRKPEPIMIPKPKEFHLQTGGSVFRPDFSERDNDRGMAAEKVNGLPGAPARPTGDPMADGVGPAAWVPRRNEPEKILDGLPLIVPMRTLEGFHVAKQSPDPRGYPVVGCDGAVGGTVKDLWIDRADQMVRYLELDAEAAGPDGKVTVLLPIQAARVNKLKGRVEVSAVKGEHFARVPRLSNPEIITAAEEERVWAYYAGGRMYAEPKRAEPVI